MEPYHINQTASLPINTQPSFSLEKAMPSPDDIEAFMNQCGNVVLVNAIIDKNKETIMANFQRDNVGAFDFGRPPPLSDPSHPLFGQLLPPIGSYVPKEEPQPTPFDPTDPNIPASTQVKNPIPQINPTTTTPSLVQTTPFQNPFAQNPSPFTPFTIAATAQPSLQTPPITQSIFG